jgi:hypothetical protein
VKLTSSKRTPSPGTAPTVTPPVRGAVGRSSSSYSVDRYRLSSYRPPTSPSTEASDAWAWRNTTTYIVIAPSVIAPAIAARAIHRYMP